MGTSKYMTTLIFVIAAAVGITSEFSLAQDREGRIESTVDRIENRRRMQQYKIEDQPSAAPAATPIAPVTRPSVLPRSQARPHIQAARSASFTTDGSDVKPRLVKRSKPPAAPAVVPRAAVRSSLPRD